jgi:putative ABC transport system permease protein
VGGLVVRLTREFGVLALAGLLVAAPLAYLAMRGWLDGFPLRIDLGPSALAGLLTAALVVVGGALAVAAAQSWRAARIAPADVLRDE